MSHTLEQQPHTHSFPRQEADRGVLTRSCTRARIPISYIENITYAQEFPISELYSKDMLAHLEEKALQHTQQSRLGFYTLNADKKPLFTQTAYNQEHDQYAARLQCADKRPILLPYQDIGTLCSSMAEVAMLPDEQYSRITPYNPHYILRMNTRKKFSLIPQVPIVQYHVGRLSHITDEQTGDIIIIYDRLDLSNAIGQIGNAYEENISILRTMRNEGIDPLILE